MTRYPTEYVHHQASKAKWQRGLRDYFKYSPGEIGSIDVPDFARFEATAEAGREGR